MSWRRRPERRRLQLRGKTPWAAGWRKFKAFSAICSPSSRTVEGDGDWRAWRDPDAAARPLSRVVPCPPTPHPRWGGARGSARAAALGAGPARSRPPRGGCQAPVGGLLLHRPGATGTRHQAALVPRPQTTGFRRSVQKLGTRKVMLPVAISWQAEALGLLGNIC